MRLVIIGCGKSKIWDKHHDIGPQKAEDVYTSGFATVKRKYAQSQGCDWMVLSAKYGFIRPDFVIPGPYNVTFNVPSTHPMSLPELKKQVEDQELGRYDEITIVGGVEYIKMTTDAFADTAVRIVTPFAHHPMGKQMEMMGDQTRKQNLLQHEKSSRR
jgi:hypothetical protein